MARPMRTPVDKTVCTASGYRPGTGEDDEARLRSLRFAYACKC